MARTIDQISDEEAIASAGENLKWTVTNSPLNRQIRSFALSAEKSRIRAFEVCQEKRNRLDFLTDELEINRAIINGDLDLLYLDGRYKENAYAIERWRDKTSRSSKLKEAYDLRLALLIVENESIYEEMENNGVTPSYEIEEEIEEVKAEISRISPSGANLVLKSGPSTFDEDRNHYSGVITKKPSGTSLA